MTRAAAVAVAATAAPDVDDYNDDGKGKCRLP